MGCARLADPHEQDNNQNKEHLQSDEQLDKKDNHTDEPAEKLLSSFMGRARLADPHEQGNDKNIKDIVTIKNDNIKETNTKIQETSCEKDQQTNVNLGEHIGIIETKESAIDTVPHEVMNESTKTEIGKVPIIAGKTETKYKVYFKNAGLGEKGADSMTTSYRTRTCFDVG